MIVLLFISPISSSNFSLFLLMNSSKSSKSFSGIETAFVPIFPHENLG